MQIGVHRFHNNQEPPGTQSHYRKFVHKLVQREQGLKTGEGDQHALSYLSNNMSTSPPYSYEDANKIAP